MKKSFDTAAQSVTFAFDDALPSITLKMADVTPENATYAMLFGFASRIGDTAALSRKQPDGTVIAVTEAMRRDAVAELVAWYQSGTKEWTARAVRTIAQNPTWAAIAAKRGVDYAVVAAEQAQRALDELNALG